MYRSRSKSLAVFLIYVAGVVAFSKAQASALTAPAPERAPSVHAEPHRADLAALARAYQDVVAAESSLSANPAAAATFGPLLREARARLEAGLAAELQARGAVAPDDRPVVAEPTNTALVPQRRPRAKRSIWV